MSYGVEKFKHVFFKNLEKINAKYEESDFSFFNNKSARYKFYSSTSLDVSIEDLKILNNSKNVICVNQYTYDILSRLSIDSNLVNIKTPYEYNFLDNKKLNIRESASYNFLSIIDTRKDDYWDVVVESFYKSFSKDDDVALILKIYNGDYQIFSQQQIVKKIHSIKERYRNSANVIFIGSEMNKRDMLRLYNNSDCYIKVNGCNLGYSFLEAYMSGLHCLGPDKGTVSSIIDSIDGYKISHSGIRKNKDGLSCYYWDVDNVSKIMKMTYSKRVEQKEKNVKRRKLIINEYMCQNVVLDFLNKVK